LITELFLYQ